jgi:hypothetical protein
LPTPDDPTSATVPPKPQYPARRAALVGSRSVDQLYPQRSLERLRRPDEALRHRRQVRFREDHDGSRAGLAREHEIALDARDVEVPITGGDNEQRVDVRGDELDPAIVARRRPLEHARSVQDPHEATAASIDEQPIADGSSVRSRWSG